MTEIPLAAVQIAVPPPGALLRRRVNSIPLPPRTLALLAAAIRGRDSFQIRDRDSFQVLPPDGTQFLTAELGAGLTKLVGLLAGGETNTACYAAAVGRLVGLGPGLTPSGDDLLVALLATARPFANPAAGAALAAAVAAIPSTATTAVAHRLLIAAAGGRFPEPLARFVSALGRPDVGRERLTRLACSLAATGAHSGADWLAGVVSLTRACSMDQPCPAR